MLDEREGIAVGRTTLRRILVNAVLKSPQRRRPPKHRVRRQRMPRQGMLIQVDGSHHPWLGDQVPSFTLLIAVDDATGTVANALFCELDFTQNPGKVMDDITFVRSHWRLVSEGFSLSTANSDVQKLPATLYHRIADSLAYAA